MSIRGSFRERVSPHCSVHRLVTPPMNKQSCEIGEYVSSALSEHRLSVRVRSSVLTLSLGSTCFVDAAEEISFPKRSLLTSRWSFLMLHVSGSFRKGEEEELKQTQRQLASMLIVINAALGFVPRIPTLD